MNQHIKIIVLFLTALSINSAGFAQQKGEGSTKSIIIMSKARLDSLLTGVAKSEKALLKSRKQQYGAKSTLKAHRSAASARSTPQKGRMHASNNVQKAHEPANSDTRIFRELDRINQKMGRMAAKIDGNASQTKNNNPRQSGTTVIPGQGGHSPTIFYQRGRRGASNRARNSGGNSRDTMSSGVKHLQKEIRALQAKMKDLEGSGHSANKKESNRLKERSDTLNTKNREANRGIAYQENQETAKKSRENRSRLTLLKNYRQAIYFANNSTALNSADKKLLSQLAQMIKKSGEQVGVLVQGYASKTGSALYNYKLSLKRAEAVKNVLIDDGISAGNIKVLGHGVNKSHNVSSARRVEISLLTD
jgi:outer membrane protein OmpA-like peptidoglycan-associated protein